MKPNYFAVVLSKVPSQAIILFWVFWLAFFQIASAQKLSMHANCSRFLDKNGNTILQLDYQVPHRNIVFLAQKGGFFAELEVLITLSKADSILFQRTVADVIGVRNKYDTSSNRNYLNRITMLVDELQSGNPDKASRTELNGFPYKLELSATDINAKRSFNWNQEITPLKRHSMISDVELCTMSPADTTQYLEKFKRGTYLFKTEPSTIFFTDEVPEITLFFEVYASIEGKERLARIELLVEKDDDIVLERTVNAQLSKEREGLTIQIPTQGLKAGTHTCFLSIQTGENTEQRHFDFTIAERKEELWFALADPEEEVNLIRVFGSVRIPTDWKSMAPDTKRRYISQAWESMAVQANLRTDELIKIIRERIDYCNTNYSHFEQGWKTDMGRIYLRNGAPDDIERDQTSDDTRFVRKDFQIWKYQKSRNSTYLFIDIQMNGNFRLIYVNNDDLESTNPDWQRYMGESFDTGLLRN